MLRILSIQVCRMVNANRFQWNFFLTLNSVFSVFSEVLVCQDYLDLADLEVFFFFLFFCQIIWLMFTNTQILNTPIYDNFYKKGSLSKELPLMQIYGNYCRSVYYKKVCRQQLQVCYIQESMHIVVIGFSDLCSLSTQFKGRILSEILI